MNEARKNGRELGPRFPLIRRSLALRGLALACFIAGLVADRASTRWLLIAMAAGLLLVPIAWRRKAPVAAGAIWSASADLMHGATKLPGQLCFTPESVVWTPSSYSRRHGEEEISVPLTGDTSVSLENGPSLLDVLIIVRRSTGEPAQFLTHRTPRLRRTIRKISPA
ncbi:MAG TPA: hypothetical protein VIJ30_07095 [Candidatus Dormibacteraeota bacterium]